MMAPGFLASPGTEHGPCLDINCGHIDCKQTREMAETICEYCGESIGYDRGFYYSHIKGFVHSACHEDAIEENRMLNAGPVKGAYDEEEQKTVSELYS